MKTTLINRLTWVSSLLLAALSADLALAQSRFMPYSRIGEKSGASDGSGQTSAVVVSGPNLRVSKTAFVDGHEVCGVIRITNSGGQAATITGIADSLEVHFPRGAIPPVPPPAGSTATWYKVADVPIEFALPASIVPGTTTTIPYCFSLCLAADYAGANSMRNVITVAIYTQSGRANVVTTRSTSFPPPALDCQACCLPDGSCRDTVSTDCESAGGLPQAIDSDCATTQCTQACCLSTGTCEDRSLSACQAPGGEPLGLGTTCATSNTTCHGACCYSVGCETGFSAQRCEAVAGTYLGNDTNCADFATTTCPSGACCFEDGCAHGADESFSISHSHCEAEGGAYLGDGVTCVTANTTCHGACCYSVGCETGFSAQRCEAVAGTYLGNDTNCADFATTTCPSGACCFEDGCAHGADESFSISHSHCEAEGGAYLGDGTTCTSTSCCISLFGSCTADSDCCSGLVCTGGACEGIVGP